MYWLLSMYNSTNYKMEQSFHSQRALIRVIISLTIKQFLFFKKDETGKILVDPTQSSGWGFKINLKLEKKNRVITSELIQLAKENGFNLSKRQWDNSIIVEHVILSTSKFLCYQICSPYKRK